MVKSSESLHKFKTYKSDAAPFFFYIDIFPLDLENFTAPLSSVLAKHVKNNPIMPLPMRVDRVFNGESSIIIRPNSPVSFPLNESIIAVINPIPFLQSGIENLLYFAEMRSKERLFRSLKPEKVSNWMENTRFLYGNLHQLEEDFSAFLKAYLYTIIKATVNEKDIAGAAIEYCDIINNICKKKMLRNKILVEINSNQESVNLYREKKAKYREKLKVVKKTEYHPELIDIEVYNFYETNFPKQEDFKNFISKNYDIIVMKYIPLLLYDDLQECMLQNMRLLETNELELLNPSILLENNVILLLDSEKTESIKLNKYDWLTDLGEIDIDVILNSINQSLIPKNKM
ncbi:MAG: hypothetical protein E3J90_07545 [Promethearchaeota archaeon]|nr:MAG: hypothetical protein E3J90_07545 [Candidatus Lokiarchaeota archaeon]